MADHFNQARDLAQAVEDRTEDGNHARPLLYCNALAGFEHRPHGWKHILGDGAENPELAELMGVADHHLDFAGTVVQPQIEAVIAGPSRLDNQVK